MSYLSWGRTLRPSQNIYRLNWRDEGFPKLADKELFLPRGYGRSYGDSCLNDRGALIDITQLNLLLHFDREKGVLRCEGGASLAQILAVIVPQGWFLPVTPGTKFVSLGGAIANDVHGKNHFASGTFGRFVRSFELLRSTGERLVCSSTENADLFRATIGGLGLTGVIIWAEIQLVPTNGGFVFDESIKFRHVRDFFDIAKDSNDKFEFTVAWIDTIASGSNLGRGHFYRGRFATKDEVNDRKIKHLADPRISVPFEAPGLLLNSWSIEAFNTGFYNKLLTEKSTHIVGYEPFFYPLDVIGHWNLMYGKKGFFQYQFVVEDEHGDKIESVLRRVSESRRSSFLAVLKHFGPLKSPGMLSFPSPGVTLTLDFSNHGETTWEFLRELDEFVHSMGGRTYPAKDSVMSPEHFRQDYPLWREFKKYVDPKASSSFWRRVGGAQ